MTTLSERPNTALVVIDVQNDVVNGSHARDAVVANISTLVDKARDEGVPIVWVQHSSEKHMPKGSDGWQYVKELSPQDSEPLVHKTYADSFEDTILKTSWRRQASAGSSSPAPRPTNASARRSTAPSSAGTT